MLSSLLGLRSRLAPASKSQVLDKSAVQVANSQTLTSLRSGGRYVLVHGTSQTMNGNKSQFSPFVPIRTVDIQYECFTIIPHMVIVTKQ